MNLAFKRIVYLFVFLIGQMIFIANSYAGPTTWEFEGEVYTNNFGGGTYWTDLGVNVGDIVTGRVSFDPDAAIISATTSPDGFGGTLLSSGFNPAFATIYDIVVNGTGYNPAYTGFTSRLRSNLNSTNPAFAIPGTSPFDTFAIDNFETGFQRFQVVRIATRPAGNGVIPQTEFLSSPPDFADLLLGQNYVQELDSNGVTSGLLARWTRVEQVPEPGIFALLSSGLFVMGFIRRKRNSQLLQDTP